MNKGMLAAGRTNMRNMTLMVLVGFLTCCPCAPAAESPRPAKAVQEKNEVSEPGFSPPGGVYTNSVLVRLKVRTAAAVVRYTLTGAEPVESSPVFPDSLTLTNSGLIKARTFLAGGRSSATICQTYVIMDDSLASFSSNLPLVILNTFEGYVSHETPVSVSARFLFNPSGRTFLTSPPDFDGRGTLKTRGRSSMEYPKRSFAFHTRDDHENPVKTPLLGLPKDSDWVLYAPYPDKTLMRDVLAYELSNKMGHYAARTKFIELFVSRAGGKLSMRSYFGVYVLVEKIKRSPRRVPIERLGPEDNAEPAISGGYIFKKDHYDKAQPRFATARGNSFYYVEPKAEEITRAQKNWLTQYLNRFEAVLYGPQFKDPRLGYAAYVDVDSLIDQHWIVEMSKNVDGIRFSNFLHKDRGGKLHMDPIWDWNLSFGNASGKQGWNPEGWYWPQLDDSEYLWFGRLFEDPDFLQKYIDRWAVLRTNVFATSNILTRVDELARLLHEAQLRNFQRWRILGRYVHPNWYMGQSYEDEVRWMKQWIQSRLAWIDNQFVAMPSFSAKEGLLAPGAAVALQAPTGKIYYTLDKTDPRSSGGSVAPGALLYTAPLPVKDKIRLEARAFNAGTWSALAVGSFAVGNAH
jgi:hypothetical protein